MTNQIDTIKREVLIEQLKAEFPSLTDRELNKETIDQLIASISEVTHQEQSAIALLIERKLEYIGSKGI